MRPEAIATTGLFISPSCPFADDLASRATRGAARAQANRESSKLLFPTVEFAIFFPIVLAISWALMSHQTLWKPFIVVVSYVFYAAADPRFCLLLGAITVVSQLAVVGDPPERRPAAAEADHGRAA